MAAYFRKLSGAHFGPLEEKGWDLVQCILVLEVCFERVGLCPKRCADKGCWRRR